MNSPASDDVLFERRGGLGLITLNRPKALNALTLDMIHAIRARLLEWAADPAIVTVAIVGAGDKAFCAGGDVRGLYESELRNPGAPILRDFFWHEYRLNRQIHRYPKPYVALIDGIAMGGGVGLSVNGRHRAVTEKATFAMPETGLGLFPDIGGSYFLSRAPGRVGEYVALTGQRLKNADMLYGRFATQGVPGAEIPELLAALEREPADAVLARFHRDPGAPPLALYRAAIDRCFAGETVEAICEALRGEGNEWASKALEILGAKSPLSLKVTLKEVRAGVTLEFEDCLRMEFRLSQAFMRGHDFFEGVRALLVDKDNQPRWDPARLEDVTDAMVEACFAPPPGGDLTFDD